MQSPLRLELDLGFREPRRCFLEIGDELLILEEPSFNKLEKIDSLSGFFAPYVKTLLTYLSFELDELRDVLNFANEIPVKYLIDILDLCELAFRQDLSIDLQLLETATESTIGRVRKELSRARQIEARNQVNKDMNYFLEQLGVYVKASKPSGLTGRQIRTTGWIPLTQAMNPKGFESVRESLTPDSWFNDEEGEKKPDPQNEEEAKKQLIEQYEQTGRIPLALVSTPKQYAKYILENSKVGFLNKSDTMDMGGYTNTLLYPTNRDKEAVQKRSDEAEVQSVSIKSRWKGKKEERKLEGLES